MRWASGLFAGLALVLTMAQLSVAGQSPTLSLPNVDLQIFLETRKTHPGSRVVVSVWIANRGTTQVGPFLIRAQPLPQVDVVPASPPQPILAGDTVVRSIVLLAQDEGVFTVNVSIHSEQGHPLLIREAGTVEVVRSSWLGLASPGLVAAVSGFLTIVGTLLVQLVIWKLNRRQRGSETVAQMVVSMARDYFGTLSGALNELARAVKQLPTSSGDEREHLLARCFFFFGTFLHKENEFAFSQGVMYLPHLWAEQAVSDISVKLLRLVPLTRAQEAVVHKCFSDIAVVQRGLPGRGPVEFEIRTLFDFEGMIRDRADYISAERRRLHEVFDAIVTQFERPETVQSILDLEEALRTIIEYESTVMFEEVYLGKKQVRELPVDAPNGFDSIIGGLAIAYPADQSVRSHEPVGRRPLKQWFQKGRSVGLLSVIPQPYF
jgi:hypothetical protein